jgi:hypothetical protein
VITQTRYSESGTSHLLVVLLVAAIAAVFPVSIATHAAASQAPAPRAVPSVHLYGSAPIASQSGPGRWSPATHVQKVAPAVVTKKVRHAHVAVQRHTTPTTSPVVQAVQAVQAPAAQPSVSAAVSDGYGCSAALAYLAKHAAPGFTFECPGYSEGHQAMTCMNVAGVCPGVNLITISVPCAAAYMNESSNSWVLSGKSNAPIDPYGYCN